MIIAGSTWGCRQNSISSTSFKTPYSAETESCGFINLKGEIVIPPKFNSLGQFRNGFANVNIGHIRGSNQFKAVISKTGKPISSKLYSNPGTMQDGLVLVYHPYRSIDSKEKTDESVHAFVANYVNEAGVDLGTSFARGGDFADGVALVRLNDSHNKYALIKHDGKVFKLIEAEPIQMQMNFSEHLLRIRINNLIGYLDTEGRIAIKPQYSDARQFSNGLAAVKLPRGKWGYINRSGKLVIPFAFDRASDFHEERAKVELDADGKRFGFIDKNGRMVFSIVSFDEYNDFSDGLSRFHFSRTNNFLDLSGQTVLKAGAGDMGDFHDGLSYAFAFSNRQTLYGYRNKDGKWAIKPQFLKASNFSEGYACVCFYDREKVEREKTERSNTPLGRE